MTEFNLLLQKAGHTVPEAAQLLGYSEGHIYRWKRGEETPREGVLNLLRMEIAGRRYPGSRCSGCGLSVSAILHCRSVQEKRPRQGSRLCR